MTAPKTNFVKVGYQNPHAEMGLSLSVTILPNTPEDIIRGNIKENAARYPEWLHAKDEKSQPAILIGGGDSINDHIEDIRKLQQAGGIVFAMNGASKWARGNGIEVDYQVILDAKPETAMLVDNGANERLLASQCDSATMEAANSLILWHLEVGGVETLFPEERVKQGGYVLVGGESTVGTCALCVAYTQGFRDIHVFGYDSSHRDGKSHAYKQSMNKTMPTMKTSWAGRTFQVSIAMKHQAEKFQIYTQALKEAGCSFTVWGDGLLQTIYNTPMKNLSEQEKYQLLWQYDIYRERSPGEKVVDFFINTFVEKFDPDDRIIDFGCGTGRAGIKLKEYGFEVLLIDFTDNCRDDEALDIPFIQWDLTNHIPVNAPHGLCTDVMEHIPTKDVQTVIDNIMDASEKVFFQISTVDDIGGRLIGATLHHTVKPHKDKFKGYKVDFAENAGIASLFYISNI